MIPSAEKAEKHTILIVDDDPTFRLMLRQFLEHHGYRVEEAENGKLALRLLRACQPDCVLMDLSMPDMDGLETCRAIHQSSGSAPPPVIMVTAQESDEALDRCYEAGAADYIHKPIHWAALRNRVQNLMAQHIADKQLKANERLLNRAQEITHTGSWEVDLATGWLQGSDELFRIFEITSAPEKATHDTLLQRIHPEDRERVATACSDAQKRGHPCISDYRLLMDDGRIKWIHEQCEHRFNYNGKPSHTTGIVQDVTAHKKAENRLDIISKLGSGTIGDGFFQLLVQATAQALDAKIAFIAELVPNDTSRARTLAMWMDGGLVDNIEYNLDGTPCEPVLHGQPQSFPNNLQALFPEDCWLAEVGAESYVGLPMTDDTGRVVGHLGMIDNKPIMEQQKYLDMMHIFTDRAIAELKRKQNDVTLQKLSQAIEHAGESILITDAKGVIEYVNPTFTKISGYSAEEAIGQTPRILNSGYQNKAFYTAMWETITRGEVWRGKVVDRKKDGSFYPAMLTIAPIIGDNGTITHFVASHTDMTDLENMEKQFHQAQKMEAIGTLVGGIAHDFNNMLAGITGNLFLAKRKSRDNPEVVQKLTDIEQISRRASEMIKQLLTFARKDRVEMQPMDCRDFIIGTLDFLKTSIPENIEARHDICMESLPITGDATLLHQVLMNLINNARDAIANTADPVISITLTPFATDKAFLSRKPHFKAGRYAHLSVADNGEGIAAEQIEHLFEPFFTTKEQGKGTGLGLAMVFGAIKTHHGFIEVESVEGNGACFHVYIPLHTGNRSAGQTPQQQEVREGEGEWILLADDETLVRETTAEVLESMHYRVIQARDGNEAITLLQAHRTEIALAVLDVIMPHCSGLALSEKLREIHPGLPVIFLTGYDDTQLLSDPAARQHCALLTKPVSFDGLNRSIRQMLD